MNESHVSEHGTVSPDEYFEVLGQSATEQQDLQAVVDAMKQEIRAEPVLEDIWKLTATQPDPDAMADVPKDRYPVTRLPQHPEDISLPPRIS